MFNNHNWYRHLHYVLYYIFFTYFYDYFVKDGLTIFKSSSIFKICTQAYYYNKIQGTFLVM